MGEVMVVRSRTRWIVVGAVVATLVAIVGWYFLVDEEPAPAASEPGSVEVKLVESGFTFTLIDDTYWEGSFGAVVENVGEQAVLSAISVNYLDVDGEIRWGGEYSNVFYLEPGEQAPVGVTHFIGFDPEVTAADVADIETTDIGLHVLGVGDPDKIPRRSIEAEVVDHRVDDVVLDYERLDGFVMRFDSPYDGSRELSGIGLVFRDESGAIIGGSGGFVELRYFDAEPRPPGLIDGKPDVPAGKSEILFHALAPIGVDLSRIEFSVDPFVDPGVNGSMWRCARCIDREDGEIAPTPPYSTWFR